MLHLSDDANAPFDGFSDDVHDYDRFPHVAVDDVLDFKQESNDCCTDFEPKQEYADDAKMTSHKVMNKMTLASVALLTESDAARVFNMGTTRFKARCRSLGIQRWPHRKLMSLKNLYYDLTMHLQRAHDNQNQELIERIKLMMSEIKSYATLLEGDLSLLNKFYNGKKAWPENILKIRQIIYKKRHAQVLVDKKKEATLKEKKAPLHGLKKQNYEEEVEEHSASEADNLHLNIYDDGIIKMDDDDIIKMDDDDIIKMGDDDIIKMGEEETIWWFLALGENTNQQA